MFVSNVNNNNKLIEKLNHLESNLNSIKVNGKFKDGEAECSLSREINEFYKSNSFNFDLAYTKEIVSVIDRCITQIDINTAELDKKINNISKTGFRATLGLAPSKNDEVALASQIVNLSRACNQINQVKKLLSISEKKINEIKLNESDNIILTHSDNGLNNIDDYKNMDQVLNRENGANGSSNEKNINELKIEKIREEIKEIDKTLNNKVSRFGIRSIFNLAISKKEAEVLNNKKARLMEELIELGGLDFSEGEDDEDETNYIMNFEPINKNI